MKIFDENGKFTPEYLEKRCNLACAIQISLKSKLDAALLALTVSENAPQRILDRLELMGDVVLEYLDMRNSEKAAKTAFELQSVKKAKNVKNAKKGN